MVFGISVTIFPALFFILLTAYLKVAFLFSILLIVIIIY